MANKIYNTRIKNKRDTSANWESKNPVLLNGEIAIVDTVSGETRFKIGDGTKKYTQLPFQDEIMRNSKADLSAGVYTAKASSTDGVVYSATVPGIDALTAGASFIMIPNKTSTSTAPRLNVNGLGAKSIRRRLNNIVTATSQGYTKTWISANKPFTVIYDGSYWIVEGMAQPVGADIYGTVPKATADEDGNVFADTYATITIVDTLLPKSGGTMTGSVTMNGVALTENEDYGDTFPETASPGKLFFKNEVNEKRITTTATIFTSWTGSAAPYTQTVSISGVLVSDTPHIIPTYSTTLATAKAQKEAWAKVSKAETAADSIIFTCFEEKPTTAIPIQIEVIR